MAQHLRLISFIAPTPTRQEEEETKEEEEEEETKEGITATAHLLLAQRPPKP
jgi:hypothetical protein